MSLFGSVMRDMEGDPIFGAHSRAMNQMNRMMNSFFGGGMGGMGMGMIESPFAPHGMGHPPQNPHARGHDMMPFGSPFMSPFGGMAMGGFPDFNGMMRQDGNSHSFSSMSVTSISSGPDGRPQVYQASKQTATGPGGVKETRKSVADSRSGTKKLSVGRHMGERAHVREREENMFTGQREENEEFVNLDEGEAEVFDHEWRQQAYGGRGRYAHSASMPAITEGEHRQHHRHAGRHPHITYPSRTSDSIPTVTIEELPPSDDEEPAHTSSIPQASVAMPSSSSARRSPYTRERKSRTKRVRKY